MPPDFITHRTVGESIITGVGQRRGCVARWLATAQAQASWPQVVAEKAHTVNTAPDRRDRQRSYSVRHQARLDTEMHAKLEELAHTFRRTHAAILRHVMQWGIADGKAWTIDRSIPAAGHPLTMVVDREFLRQVQAAAAAHGASVAAWERHAMRQVTLEDFAPSWRAGETVSRSHESRAYGKRFMLRLDDATRTKLTTLTQTFHRSGAEVIRQLIAQARPEDFPESWHLAVEEGRQRQARSAGGDR
jgi:predicted transcriptional regulator